MKKVLLILFVALIAVGCTKEVSQRCTAVMSLSFTLDGSAAKFDDEIGNDVLLHIYRDNKFSTSRLVKYEEIAGGKPYLYRKKFTGKVDLVAWAVPAGCQEDLFAGCSVDEEYSAAYYELGKGTKRPVNKITPAGSNLYMGKINGDQDIREDTSFEIPLANSFCNVTVVVEDAADFVSRYSGNLTMELEGSSSRYLVHTLESSGEPVVITSSFAEGGDNMLTTPTMGIMPASKDGRGNNRKLVAKIYNDGALAFTFDTKQEAVAGKQIKIVIRCQEGQAETIVDKWKVKVQLVFV